MIDPLQKQIYVYTDWNESSPPVLMGVLSAAISRGREIFSFNYNNNWLKSHNGSSLDPALQLFSGIQYAPHDLPNFNLFLDSAPDRWGRFLMERRESMLASLEKRPNNKLMESDYLLGVFDEQRIGALRFSLNPNGPFLDNNAKFASPPWASIRELEKASLELEKNNAKQNPDYLKWLQMLIAPGSSLGGARPKASVIDNSKNLWIAKFPSANDDHDVGAWEMLVNNLAKKAGINTTTALMKKFNVKQRTFLSKRFDRTATGGRIHFASALTLLQRTDGDSGTTGASYLELAEFIMQHGAKPDLDLEELWRRIVFFICVSNVDDHLRNHGFILEANGWRLSKAYDMNPVAYGNGLTLNISEFDNSQNIALILSVAKYFRLDNGQANAIIDEVVNAVISWKVEAKSLKIPKDEQDYMANAFRVAENYKI